LCALLMSEHVRTCVGEECSGFAYARACVL